MEEKTKRMPVHSGDLGPLQYAIWENRSQNGKCFVNVEFTRNFQDQDGWQTEKLRLRDYQVVILGHLLGRCIGDLDTHATNDSNESSTA